MKKIEEIRELLQTMSKSDINELKLDTQEMKLSVKKSADIVKNVQLPKTINNRHVTAQQESPSVAAKQASSKPEPDYKTVKSTFIGTFYRKSFSKNTELVEIGHQINEGDVLGTIQALKLNNEVKSEVAGKVAQVLVEDGTPVEYDQSLFLIE